MEGNGAARKQIGRFQPGQSGNPAGRPKGSRHKLAEDFLKALSDDFAEHSAAAIAECRTKKVEHYVKIVAGLLPRHAEISVGPSEELQVALRQFTGDYLAVKDALQRIGANPTVLEAITIDEDD